jgi:hypothetical protein
MSVLREVIAELLERRGAAVEAIGSEELAVLVPAEIQKSMGWPELARLAFGAERSHEAIAIGLEGDWLDRFATLLGDEGRWSEREVRLASGVAAPGDPLQVLDRALNLPNAIWRFRGMNETWTRLLVLTFRYAAVSDDKREGLIWLGINTGTGAIINDLLPRLRLELARTPDWHMPGPGTVLAAGLKWDATVIESKLRGMVDRQVRDEIEPFLRAMRRRLARDRDRVHAYHDELHRAASKRLAALADTSGERLEADRRREALRLEAIEREHRAKLDDLRHNYALSVSVEWVQALELYVPVQRLDVLIRRRKGERLIQLDWHPLIKTAEPPLCEAGLGSDRVRLVCDDKLHLTEPGGQAPCLSCGKAFCRACFPTACPRCGHSRTHHEPEPELHPEPPETMDRCTAPMEA